MEEEKRMDIVEDMTLQNSSEKDWKQEEATAKLVLEGILLPTVSSFGFLGKSTFWITNVYINSDCDFNFVQQ